MDKLIGIIEKGQPFFQALARNKYLKSIKNGFVSAMPIIIFSSIFLLVADVPKIWGFVWDDATYAFLMKMYNYSMGIFALIVAGSTAKHFADAQNKELPATNQINPLSAMFAAIIGFLLVSSDRVTAVLENGTEVAAFSGSYLGSAGLLTAFMSAFVVGIVYKFFIGRDITIKMPEQVPPNISQTFKDIIPFGVSLIAFWVFDAVFRNFVGYSFAQGVIAVFQPIFSAADGYLGLALIFGAMAFFWFAGVHGPSIVEPAVSAAMLANVTANIELVNAGQQATNILTQGSQYFVATLGGTGATLVATLMFAFIAKSKEMRAVGRASSVPVLFGVNEPFLFGAPMVLNPVFFVPFILAPIANIWLFKFFVDFLGMNSFIYTMPWTCPGPIGVILGTGIAPLAFVFVVAVCAMDFFIYLPFVKVYDKQKCAEEAEREAELHAAPAAAAPAAAPAMTVAEAAAAVTSSEPAAKPAEPAGTGLERLNGTRTLVLCAGGGTSGLLANALAKAARERGIDHETAAGSYGAHQDMMADFDLVVLAPQVATYAEELKADTDRLGIKSVACAGKQYIDLTRDGEKSLQFVYDILFEDK